MEKSKIRLPNLPGPAFKKSDPGRTGGDGRLFLEAVLWIARTGSPWRDLPPGFGSWNTVFKRFRHWVKADVFKRIFDVVSDEADMEFAFRGKAATDSDLIRPPITRQNGQSGWSCDRVRWVILTGDRRGAQTIATQKHDTRPPYVFLTALGVRDDRSQSLTVDTTKDIPLRMRQTRMPQHNGESQIGLFCSNQTTRTPAADQMVRWPRKIGQVLKFRLFRQ